MKKKNMLLETAADLIVESSILVWIGVLYQGSIGTLIVQKDDRFQVWVPGQVFAQIV